MHLRLAWKERTIERANFAVERDGARLN